MLWQPNKYAYMSHKRCPKFTSRPMGFGVQVAHIALGQLEAKVVTQMCDQTGVRRFRAMGIHMLSDSSGYFAVCVF